MGSDNRATRPLPSPGPFLAEITNHLDATYMGMLEVSLVKSVQPDVKNQGNTYIVRYLSPFYGVTNPKFQGNESKNFNDVQKSYGMWMIPPDVGSRVLVIFLDGDPNQGYWIGCVQDMFQNHMVPGIAASQYTDITPEQEARYGTKYLPVGEYLKTVDRGDTPNPNKIKKPVHPFADRLLAQGLLLDTVRGITTTSARREVPSQVFGISTPGPLDPNGKTGKIGYGSGIDAPVSRLGGSTFVMDDGDINGQNELVRIRTRTGHQILLHNSHDLIYIANSKGTAWLEMTSGGKIDIFATDSVSIHSKVDFNFRADRDINLEAGRNFNIRALGNMETNVTGHYFLLVDDYGKIGFKNDLDHTVGGTTRSTIGQDLNLAIAKDFKATTGNDTHIISGESLKIGTGGDFSIDANGNIIQTGVQIHLNGPAAPAPTNADSSTLPPELKIFSLPNRSPSKPWAPEIKYKTDDIKSIMLRVPTHEPWDDHENVAPDKFTPEATDITTADAPSVPPLPPPPPPPPPGSPSPPGSPPPPPPPPPSNNSAQQSGGASSNGNSSGGSTNNSSGGNTIPPSDRVAAGVSPSSNAGIQTMAHSPEIITGVPNPTYAAVINNPSSLPGISAISAAAARLGLTGINAVASLLSIVGGENQWQPVAQDFNYSSAARLLEVYPTVFRGDTALAQQYVGNPNNSLPEFLYGYQTYLGKGLGNTQPGDGAIFIGRGFIQIAGRANYTKYSRELYVRALVPSPTYLVDNPELALDVTIASYLAVLYMLDNVNVSQNDPGYFNTAYRKVGYNSPDVNTTKSGLYQCFVAQLQSSIGTNATGPNSKKSNGILTDNLGHSIIIGQNSQ